MGSEEFEFSEKKRIIWNEKKLQELENVSHKEASDVVRSIKLLPKVDIQEIDKVEKSLHYIQLGHVIEQPMTRQAVAKQNFKKAEIS